MRALIIYTPANKTIISVQSVPNEIISVNPDKNFVIEDTEELTPLFEAKGYDVTPIIDYELANA